MRKEKIAFVRGKIAFVRGKNYNLPEVM